jgi:hypothetical protein
MLLNRQQEVLGLDLLCISQTVEQQMILLFRLEDIPYLKLALLVLNMVCYSSAKGVFDHDTQPSTGSFAIRSVEYKPNG